MDAYSFILFIIFETHFRVANMYPATPRSRKMILVYLDATIIFILKQGTGIQMLDPS